MSDDIETSSPPSPIFHSPRGQDDDENHLTDRIDGILNAHDEKSPTSAMAASTARKVRRRGTIDLPDDGTKVRSFGRRPLSCRLTIEDTGIWGGATCPFAKLQREKRRASYRADDDAEVEKADEKHPASSRSSHTGPRFVPPKTRHDSSPSSRPRFVPSTTPNEMSPSEPSSSITGRPVFVPPRETDHNEVRNDRIIRLFDDARRQLTSSGEDRSLGGNKNVMPKFIPPVDDYEGFVGLTIVPPVHPYDYNEDEGSGTFQPRPRLVPSVVDNGSVNSEAIKSRICRTLREDNIAMPRSEHVKGAAYIPSGYSRPEFRPCRMHLQDDDNGEVSSVAAVKDPALDHSSQHSRRRAARGTIEVPVEIRKPVGLPIVDGQGKEARKPRRRRGTIEIPDSVRRPVGTPVVDVVKKPSKMRTKLERLSQPVCSYGSDACVGADVNEVEVGGEPEDPENPDEPDTSLSKHLEARLATARRIREMLRDKSNCGDKTKRKRRVTIEGLCPAVPSAEGGKAYDYTVQQQSTQLAGDLSELRDLRSSSTTESYPVGSPVEDSTLDWAVGASDSHRSGSTGTVVSLTLDRIAEIKARFDQRRAKSEHSGSRSIKSSSTASITVGNLLDDSTRTDASEGSRRRSTASDAEGIFEAHNSSFMCDNICGHREDILSKSDNPSRWSAALDRYRRDVKSTDHSASEELTDDLPEDEVGRRGSSSEHDSFASLRSLGQSKLGYALTDPTAAMSSLSFCLAKEEGRVDFVARPARHVGSHISVRPLDESVSSLETSARSSERRRYRPTGRRSGGPTPTEEQIFAVRKKKNPWMRRRASADCVEDAGMRNVVHWDQDGMG